MKACGRVEDPLPLISKQDAEHTPLSPGTNLPTKNQRSIELDRSLQMCLQKSGVQFLFHQSGVQLLKSLPSCGSPSSGSVEM